MINDWREVKLSDCADFQEGYVNPSQTKEEYFDGDIKWLRAVDLNDGFVFETSRTITEAGFKSAGKSALLFEPDTLAISKSGTIGRVGILKDYMCGNRAVINIKVNKNYYDNRFIFYVLKANRALIENLAIGSVQKNLYTSALGSLEFRCPNFSYQESISRILGSLDDKIELNYQINKTLESMAQALFKSWFVDFDPVIDNAIAAGNPIPEPFQARAERRRLRLHEQVPEGQSALQPLPSELRQIFPNSFQETEELGWVPEGWEHKFLKDIVNIKYGKNLPTSKLVKEGFPVFGGNGVIGFYNYFLYEHPHVLIACRGAASGKVLLSLPKSYVTNNSLIVEHGDSGLNAYFLFNSLSIQDLRSLTSGSAQPQMTIDNLNPVRILVPSRNLLDTFNKVTSVLYLKQLANSGESEVLVEIRNKLIPKLLSGQLRIPDAEAQLAEASV